MTIDPNNMRAIRELALNIGKAAPDAVLVGGQSVLFWAERFGIILPDEDIPALTEDVDFMAGIADIMDAENALSAKYRVDTKIATMDDTSPNSGKMTVHLPSGKLNVDFLRMITGLDSGEVVSDAVILTIDDSEIKIISPVNLLKSKISNLGCHLGKRNPEGVEQGRIAIEIMRHYLSCKINTNPKSAYRDFEQVIRLAMGDPSLYANRYCGLDTLYAIPVSALRPDDPFLLRRYPVAVKQVEIKRQKFDDMIERMAKFDNDAESSRFHH